MSNNLFIPKREEKGEVRKEIFSRTMKLYYVFLVMGLAIILRILYLQYSPLGSELRKEAMSEKSFGLKAIPAKRGNILSHDGRILATTIPTFHIYMDFRAEGLSDEKFNEKVKSLSDSLSAFFKDKSPKAYLDSLSKWQKQGLRYKRISPRRIDYIEYKRVSEFPIFSEGRNRGGMVLDTLQKRVFPHESLAIRTVGRVNQEGLKLGIEGAFDSLLRGSDGLSAVQKISGSFWMPIQSESNRDPIDGYDVTTTIDIEIQDVAERALRKQLIEKEAMWGTAILMEVETGEVRAIANLARKENNECVEDFNYGIAQNMEPGSTFKLVTLMTLLDDAKVNINELVNTEGGFVQIGSAQIKDSNGRGYGTISLKKVFEVSSNVGFAKMTHKYYGANPSRFVNHLYDMGIDKKFDLQIPGEASPIIRKPGDKLWNGSSLVMMGYGYALLMSPIHTLAIYNSIPNNGKYISPLFVKEISKNGTVIEEFSAKVINEKICSDKVIDNVKESMEGVVYEGTGKSLFNENYQIAVKTGTAQIANGRFGYRFGDGRRYLATIVGYFPADKPKYSCIVAIQTHHPDGSAKSYYGGSLAGPVLKAISDKVYSQAVDWGDNIAKPKMTPIGYGNKKEIEKSYSRTPSVKGGESKHVKTIMSELNLPIIDIKEDIVQIDSSMKTTGASIKEGYMPNVYKMGLRDAIYILEKQGLKVKYTGKGSVSSQSIQPNQAINKGDTVLLQLK